MFTIYKYYPWDKKEISFSNLYFSFHIKILHSHQVINRAQPKVINYIEPTVNPKIKFFVFSKIPGYCRIPIPLSRMHIFIFIKSLSLLMLNWSEIEKKWQSRWLESRIFESEPDNRKKFFLIFAYPGISGYLHIGHMRGYTYTDIIARYKRLTGHNVLFPVGTHATGNLAIAFANKVAKNDRVWIEYLKNNGCPEDKIPELATPDKVIEYFNHIYVEEYWKKFGFSADYRRFLCTAYPDYQKFIQWQFKKLNEKGLLIQKPYYAPYCPEHGPVAVDVSETDLQKGGKAEKLEFVMLYFTLDDGRILPCATLRPETVFGVTNVWLNSHGKYVEIELNDKTLIVSEPGYIKISAQYDNVKLKSVVDVRTLLGKYVTVPLRNEKVLILPSKLVDTKIATGVVMSVPAHAPFDWIGLQDIDKEELKKFDIPEELVKKIKPISLINIIQEPIKTTIGEITPAPDHFPPSGYQAIDICRQLNITSLSQWSKLEEATQIVYKQEFHTGILNERCGIYSGLKVSQVKDKIINDMLSGNIANIIYEFSEEVVCRCGKNVIIKKLEDQWFIDYDNPDLVEKSKEHAKEMSIYPREYYDNVQSVLEWFGDRACVRIGNWIGTKFPFDEKWIIEAISDSTLYPAYYIISKYYNSGELTLENLTDEFFDFVILGKGEPDFVATQSKLSREILQKIRNDFIYWYPLDLNIGGKEHMTVHFPAFIKNHVAIVAPEHYPRGIFVNWYLIMKGGKISKSKGGAVPIPDATTQFTVDGMRLYYAHVSSPHADIEWNNDTVMDYKNRLEKIYNFIEELRTQNSEFRIPNFELRISKIDLWLSGSIKNLLKNYFNAMEKLDLRTGANECFFNFMEIIRWYITRKGSNKELIQKILEIWIKIMAPFTPHLAEELWEKCGMWNAERRRWNFVSLESLSKESIRELTEVKPDELIAISEEFYLKALIEDLSHIIKVVKIKPKNIVFYVTAEKWKYEIFRSLALRSLLNVDYSAFIKEFTTIYKEHAKEIPNYIKKVVDYLRKLDAKPELKNRQFIESFDEFAFYSREKNFLEQWFQCSVNVYKSDDPKKYDPKNKSSQALPFKPGIYIE